ncbi:MAG: gfo/Idh/MocA family oxidoreductase, partial [Pirellulales bacterium]
DTARQYRESFDVTGSKKSIDRQQLDGEDPVIHTKGLPENEIPKRVKVPDFGHLLPEGIRDFTTKGVYDMEGSQHLSFTQGSGHGGSHPHLAHEFVMSIVQGRPARPDAEISANWTMVGICAHQSATKGGTRVKIPVL